MAHTLTDPIREVIQDLREDWHNDRVGFWLMFFLFTCLAVLVLFVVGMIVMIILGVTGVVPFGSGGGSSHYLPHGGGVYVPMPRGGMIHVG